MNNVTCPVTQNPHS